MSIQDFYAEPHLDTADGFGSMAGGRTNPHRGLDVNGWGTGTDVPNLYVGTVSRSEWQSGLGNVVCVAADAGFYVGYAHLDSRYVSAGDRVDAGTIVGTLGNTGSLSFGAHTHVTVSYDSNNPSSGPTVDPYPFIIAARDGGAVPGGGSTPAASDVQAGIQDIYRQLGLYDGPVDGVFGPNCWRITQQWLTNYGLYSGPIDGDPGPNTYKGFQSYGAKNGNYSGPIDGDLGPNSWAGYLQSLKEDTASQLAAPAASPAPAPVTPDVTPAPAPSVYWPAEATWPLDGIDVSGAQSNADGSTKVDFGAFKAAGGEFVIIKWAGANTGNLYLADGREDHLAKARAAGLKIGFYYVPNNALSATDQSDYFVHSLLSVIQPGDIVALDNEPLDGATYLPPAESERFLDAVAKGLSLTPFFYSNPHIIRGGEDWSGIAAKYPLWVAAYNSNDGTTAGGTIDPKKYWDEIAVWQYTSVGVIPGYSGNIDRNVAEKDIFEKYGYKVPSVVASTPSTGGSTESSGGLSSATPLPSPLEQAGTTIQDVVSDVINNIKDAPTVSAETQAQQAQVIAEKVQPVDLGSIITNPVTRKVIWSIYGLTGLLIIGLMGGLTAAQWLAPEWFIFATGVYTAVSPAFASLAIANISTTKK